MIKTLKRSLQALMIVPLLALGVSLVTPAFSDTPVSAAEYNLKGGANASHGDGTPENLFNGDDPIFKTIVNILLFIIGAISVIMLIIGGIRYVISNGNSEAVGAAKNTILYAVVGVIVALLAYAIINFVITGLSDNL